MSAFVVNDMTIHYAAQVLAEPYASCEQIDHLGIEMLRLNIRAVNTRYPGRNVDITLADQYRYSPRKPDQFQQLKSLQCWLYQCDESDELRAHPLWQKGRQVEYQLLCDIVSMLPEYKAVKWGN